MCGDPACDAEKPRNALFAQRLTDAIVKASSALEVRRPISPQQWAPQVFIIGLPSASAEEPPPELAAIRALATKFRRLLGSVTVAPAVPPPFSTGDLVIWLGDGGALGRATLLRARRARALAIHFNTQPLQQQCQGILSQAHEHWDYSLQNLVHCSASAGSRIPTATSSSSRESRPSPLRSTRRHSCSNECV